MADGSIDLKSINLNTVISVAGFLGTFVLVGIAWGTTQSRVGDLEDWRTQHETAHRDLVADMRSNFAALSERIKGIDTTLFKMTEFEYRLAQVEKEYETTDNRISRVTESYSNQFADMRTQLSAISTQIALTNQTLQRMENSPPRVPSQP
jgi:hypothetical protein